MRATLESYEDFEVVGEAGDGAEAVRLAHDCRPDVILLDIAMPTMDGLEAIPEIMRESPGSRIVVLSGFERERMAEQALETGASAYLEKGVRPQEVVTLLRSVASGCCD